MDRKLKFPNVRNNSVQRKFQPVEQKVLVAPASRRLLSPSMTSNCVGKDPTPPQHTTESDRLNSRHYCQQLERRNSSKLRNSFLLVLLSLALSPNAPVNAQTNTARPANPAPSTQSPSTPAAKQAPLEDKIEKYLRNMYAWGPQYEIKLGPTKPSPIPDLLEVPVTVGLNGQSDTAIVYVSKDGKFIFRGELTDMSVDPLAETRSKLHPGTSPSLGPTDAKITLVEFADFECPSCRQFDHILRELLPQHPEIRLIYKDFPLTTIHPWAMTASIAGRCAFHQSPASFWKIHDIIFDAQDVITPSNVWEKMTDFANQLGLNAETFRACMANPDTVREIDQTTAEGHELSITGTPTIFVNGRRIVGPDESLLKQFIDFESLTLYKHNIAYEPSIVKSYISRIILIFSGLPAQEEFELEAFRWVRGRGGAASRENVSDSVGQRIEAERRDAEKALGDNRESLAQNFQLQFLPQERGREVGRRGHQ